MSWRGWEMLDLDCGSARAPACAGLLGCSATMLVDDLSLESLISKYRVWAQQRCEQMRQGLLFSPL